MKFSIAFAFFLKSVAAFVAYFMSIYVARKLGVTDSGYVFLLITIITLLSCFSRLGFENSVVKYVALQSDESNNASSSLIFRVLFIASIVSLIFGFGLYCFSDRLSNHLFQKPEMEAYLKAGGLCILPFTVFYLNAFVFRGLGKVTLSIFFQNISFPTMIIIFFYFIDLSVAPFKSASIVFYSAALSAFLSLCFVVKAIGFSNYFSVKSNEWSFFKKSSRRMYGIQVSILGAQWFGLIIIGIYCSTEDVALYSAAQRTSMLVSFFLMALNVVTAAKYARFYSEGNIDKIEKLSLLSSRILFVIGLFCFILILFFNVKIMELFGEGFSSAGVLLVILSIGQLVNITTGSVGNLLQMSGNESDYLISVGGSLLLLIILSMIFIPIYGVLGGAVVTASAISFQNLIGVYFVKKRLGFNTLSFFVTSKL